MSPTDKKQNEQTGKSDRACALCRERKIRCGREKPKCSNCKRQGWKCDYSIPEKRVSHIKLLCNNVGSLDSRLSNIEGELSRMAKLQGSNQHSIRSEGSPSRSNSPTDSLFDPKAAGEDSEGHPMSSRSHVIQSDSADCYYGPDTLYAFCASFRDYVLSERQAQASQLPSLQQDLDLIGGKKSDPIDQHLAQLMKCVETNETLGNEPGDSQILLPPKQFLLMLHTRFFHQNDWNTDLFVQSHFWANVERVYNNYSPSIDEPWAIAFNTIILLSLSTDGSTNGHEPLMGSQFAQPFFSTIRAAVNKFWILMSPRLINVQTLVLLSIAAELFYPPNLAEALLARACLLARQMGLNQSDMVDKGVSPEEQEERLKVYRSLYIRDKSLGVSRGTVCWLPGFEIQRLPSDESDSGEASYNTARVRIAAFQERVYRLHSSANAQGDFANKSGFHPSGIQNGLQELLRSENIFEQPMNIPDIDLWLEFLATRIIALRRNPKSKFIDRTLQDARASCILLLMALGKSSEALSRRLEKLCDLPGNSEDSNSPINPTLGKFSAPMLCRSPLDIFPVSAFFLLAANIIRPMTSSEQTIGEDLDLLLRVTSCYEEANEKLRADNRAHRLCRAFEKILRIVDCTQDPDGTPAPSLPTTNGSSNDTRSIGSNLLSLSLSKSYPEMADMENLSAQNSFVSGAFPNQQNAQLPSDAFGSYIASEPDNMNTFMIPPQHLDQGSNFQFDGNSMMSDASFDVAQAQLAADNFGFDMSLTS